MHDGVELEKRRIPTAVIVTDLFIPTAKTQASISGIPAYSFVAIDHPIGRLTEKEIKEKAELATQQVTNMLLKV